MAEPKTFGKILAYGILCPQKEKDEIFFGEYIMLVYSCVRKTNAHILRMRISSVSSAVVMAMFKFTSVPVQYIMIWYYTLTNWAGIHCRDILLAAFSVLTDQKG